MQEVAELSHREQESLRQFKVNTALKVLDQNMALAGKKLRKYLTPRELMAKFKACTLTKKDVLGFGYGT